MRRLSLIAFGEDARALTGIGYHVLPEGEVEGPALDFEDFLFFALGLGGAEREGEG